MSRPARQRGVAVATSCIVALAAILASACTTTVTSDPPKPPGDSATTDGGHTTKASDAGTADDHGCAAACAAYVGADCPGQTKSECMSACVQKAAKCPKQAEAANACVPTTTVSCRADGLAVPDGCDAELAALGACVRGSTGGGTTGGGASCTPHPASGNDATSCASDDCTQPTYVSVGSGPNHVWCTTKCTSDASCDTSSGTTGVFGCDGTVCRARCITDDDCAGVSGAVGCGGGYCY